MNLRTFTLAAAVVSIMAILLGSAADAHVTLQTEAAPVGSFYKAVLRVPHGCDGSPTVALEVEIPPGVIAVKPQPKPGWKIEIARKRYQRSYSFHGKDVSDGVGVLTWSGSKLPDEYYDEFAFNAFLSDVLPTKTILYFRVTQTCDSGKNAWTDIADDSKEPHAKSHPAPHLRLVPGVHSEH